VEQRDRDWLPAQRHWSVVLAEQVRREEASRWNGFLSQGETQKREAGLAQQAGSGRFVDRRTRQGALGQVPHDPALS
jgi:hypothetical protein